MTTPQPSRRWPRWWRRWSSARAREGPSGSAFPGTLSPGTGLVKNANSVWLIGRPLRDDLQRRLGREVRIANDANCLAVSEAADGAAAGADVVFGAIIGTGVGAGIVVRGRLVPGANSIAGEWGHNPLPWPLDEERPGPACYCGRHGCIETFVSGPALVADFERCTGHREGPPEIVTRAARGDAAAEATLVRYEDRVARALAGVINLLDPDVIVLGGGVSNIERLYEHVPRLWGRYVFACGAVSTPDAATPSSTAPNSTTRNSQGATTPGARGLGVGSLGVGNCESVRTRLVRSKHGDASGVRGAAWLWPGVTSTEGQG